MLSLQEMLLHPNLNPGHASNIVIALREVAAGRVSVEEGETEHKEADHQEGK